MKKLKRGVRVSTLIKQSNYVLDLEGKQYPFVVEEFVLAGQGWPQKFRARFVASRAAQATSEYGDTELQAAESFVNKIKESYRAT